MSEGNGALGYPVGNAPCSWGTIEGVEGARVSWSQMLDELKATGYQGTELGDYGFMPTDPARLGDELAARGLSMLGAYEGVYLRDPAEHAAGRGRAVRTARLLNEVAHVGDPDWRPRLVLADQHSRDAARFDSAGRVTPDLSLAADEWRVFARGADEIATAVEGETGLETVFHPHCAGYVETPDEIERFLELTREGLGMVLDTGHYLYGTGGNDPREVERAFDRFAGRVGYVHFKDCHPVIAEAARREGLDYRQAVGRGVFCELGEGAVDFERVLEKMRATGYSGWVTVEQDVLPGMGSPRESAERNRRYLRSIGM